MRQFATNPPAEFKISDKLEARQFVQTDAQMLLELALDEAVSRFVPWAKYITTIESASWQIANFSETREDNTFNRYAVVLDGSSVGYIGCWPDDKEGFYEFGFAILPKTRGIGIGKAAVMSLMDILKTECEALGIVAYVNDDNEASKTVVTKLGFTPLDEINENERRYELSLSNVE